MTRVGVRMACSSGASFGNTSQISQRKRDEVFVSNPLRRFYS